MRANFGVPADNEQHPQLRGDVVGVANPEAAKIELVEFVVIGQFHDANQHRLTSTVPHTGRSMNG